MFISLVLPLFLCLSLVVSSLLLFTIPLRLLPLEQPYRVGTEETLRLTVTVTPTLTKSVHSVSSLSYPRTVQVVFHLPSQLRRLNKTLWDVVLKHGKDGNKDTGREVPFRGTPILWSCKRQMDIVLPFTFLVNLNNAPSCQSVTTETSGDGDRPHYFLKP